MSVEIDPPELGFRKPFTEEVGEILRIKNTNTSPVAFKVKTTAPKQYCVRPNSGRIEPGHEVEVSVLLQPMKADPPLDARCRDKFLVQSVTITSDKDFNNWDSVDKGAVLEKKIRVNWLPPLENGHSVPAFTPIRQSLANGFEATPEVPQPAFSSPAIDSAMTEKSTGYHNTEPMHEPKREAELETKRELAVSPSTAPATPRATVEPAKVTAAATYNELKERLAKAEAKLANMTNEATSGLRQRNTGSSGPVEKGAVPPVGELAQAMRPSPAVTEGVPVQIVAALCLISFLLAYFFF